MSDHSSDHSRSSSGSQSSRGSQRRHGDDEESSYSSESRSRSSRSYSSRSRSSRRSEGSYSSSESTFYSKTKKRPQDAEDEEGSYDDDSRSRSSASNSDYDDNSLGSKSKHSYDNHNEDSRGSQSDHSSNRDSEDDASKRSRSSHSSSYSSRSRSSRSSSSSSSSYSSRSRSSRHSSGSNSSRSRRSKRSENGSNRSRSPTNRSASQGSKRSTSRNSDDDDDRSRESSSHRSYSSRSSSSHSSSSYVSPSRSSQSAGDGSERSRSKHSNDSSRSRSSHTSSSRGSKRPTSPNDNDRSRGSSSHRSYSSRSSSSHSSSSYVSPSRSSQSSGDGSERSRSKHSNDSSRSTSSHRSSSRGSRRSTSQHDNDDDDRSRGSSHRSYSSRSRSSHSSSSYVSPSRSSRSSSDGSKRSRSKHSDDSSRSRSSHRSSSRGSRRSTSQHDDDDDHSRRSSRSSYSSRSRSSHSSSSYVSPSRSSQSAGDGSERSRSKHSNDSSRSRSSHRSSSRGSKASTPQDDGNDDRSRGSSRSSYSSRSRSSHPSYSSRSRSSRSSDDGSKRSRSEHSNDDHSRASNSQASDGSPSRSSVVSESYSSESRRSIHSRSIESAGDKKDDNSIGSRNSQSSRDDSNTRGSSSHSDNRSRNSDSSRRSSSSRSGSGGNATKTPNWLHDDSSSSSPSQSSKTGSQRPSNNKNNSGDRSSHSGNVSPRHPSSSKRSSASSDVSRREKNSGFVASFGGENDDVGKSDFFDSSNWPEAQNVAATESKGEKRPEQEISSKHSSEHFSVAEDTFSMVKGSNFSASFNVDDKDDAKPTSKSALGPASGEGSTSDSAKVNSSSPFDAFGGDYTPQTVAPFDGGDAFEASDPFGGDITGQSPGEERSSEKNQEQSARSSRHGSDASSQSSAEPSKEMSDSHSASNHSKSPSRLSHSSPANASRKRHTSSKSARRRSSRSSSSEESHSTSSKHRNDGDGTRGDGFENTSFEDDLFAQDIQSQPTIPPKSKDLPPPPPGYADNFPDDLFDDSPTKAETGFTDFPAQAGSGDDLFGSPTGSAESGFDDDDDDFFESSKPRSLRLEETTDDPANKAASPTEEQFPEPSTFDSDDAEPSQEAFFASVRSQNLSQKLSEDSEIVDDDFFGNSFPSTASKEDEKASDAGEDLFSIHEKSMASRDFSKNSSTSSVQTKKSKGSSSSRGEDHDFFPKTPQRRSSDLISVTSKMSRDSRGSRASSKDPRQSNTGGPVTISEFLPPRPQRQSSMGSGMVSRGTRFSTEPSITLTDIFSPSVTGSVGSPVSQERRSAVGRNRSDNSKHKKQHGNDPSITLSDVFNPSIGSPTSQKESHSRMERSSSDSSRPDVKEEIEFKPSPSKKKSGLFSSFSLRKGSKHEKEASISLSDVFGQSSGVESTKSKGSSTRHTASSTDSPKTSRSGKVEPAISTEKKDLTPAEIPFVPSPKKRLSATSFNLFSSSKSQRNSRELPNKIDDIFQSSTLDGDNSRTMSRDEKTRSSSVSGDSSLSKNNDIPSTRRSSFTVPYIAAETSSPQQPSSGTTSQQADGSFLSPTGKNIPTPVAPPMFEDTTGTRQDISMRDVFGSPTTEQGPTTNNSKDDMKVQDFVNKGDSPISKPGIPDEGNASENPGDVFDIFRDGDDSNSDFFGPVKAKGKADDAASHAVVSNENNLFKSPLSESDRRLIEKPNGTLHGDTSGRSHENKPPSQDSHKSGHLTEPSRNVTSSPNASLQSSDNTSGELKPAKTQTRPSRSSSGKNANEKRRSSATKSSKRTRSSHSSSYDSSPSKNEDNSAVFAESMSGLSSASGTASSPYSRQQQGSSRRSIGTKSSRQSSFHQMSRRSSANRSSDFSSEKSPDGPEPGTFDRRPSFNNVDAEAEAVNDFFFSIEDSGFGTPTTAASGDNNNGRAPGLFTFHDTGNDDGGSQDSRTDQLLAFAEELSKGPTSVASITSLIAKQLGFGHQDEEQDSLSGSLSFSKTSWSKGSLSKRSSSPQSSASGEDSVFSMSSSKLSSEDLSKASQRSHDPESSRTDSENLSSRHSSKASSQYSGSDQSSRASSRRSSRADNSSSSVSTTADRDVFDENSSRFSGSRSPGSSSNASQSTSNKSRKSKFSENSSHRSDSVSQGSSSRSPIASESSRTSYDDHSSWTSRSAKPRKKAGDEDSSRSYRSRRSSSSKSSSTGFQSSNSSRISKSDRDSSRRSISKSHRSSSRRSAPKMPRPSTSKGARSNHPLGSSSSKSPESSSNGSKSSRSAKYSRSSSRFSDSPKSSSNSREASSTSKSSSARSSTKLGFGFSEPRGTILSLGDSPVIFEETKHSLSNKSLSSSSHDSPSRRTTQNASESTRSASIQHEHHITPLDSEVLSSPQKDASTYARRSPSISVLRDVSVGLLTTKERIYETIRNDGYIYAVEFAYWKLVELRPRLKFLLSLAEWRHVHILMLYARIFEVEVSAANLVQPPEFQIALPSDIQLFEPFAAVLNSIGVVEDDVLGAEYIPVAKPLRHQTDKGLSLYKPHDPEDVTEFLEWTQYDWNASWTDVEVSREARRREAEESGVKIPETTFPPNHDKLLDWENLAVEKWLGWDDNLWFSYKQATHILSRKTVFVKFPRETTRGTYSWLIPRVTNDNGVYCRIPKSSLGAEVWMIALLFNFSLLPTKRTDSWYYQTKEVQDSAELMNQFLASGFR